jgi:cold shock CspA family protein
MVGMPGGLQDGRAIAYDIEQDRGTGKASATNLCIDT